MIEWKKYKFSDFLTRIKTSIIIEDLESYKRVTIKTKHGGVLLRDIEVGLKIGTKKQFILREGQFILSKIDARYGAFGIAPKEVDNAIITGNFWAYDFDKEIISIEWLDNFTNSPSFYDLCERASSGITHRKYLNESEFLNNEIFLPLIEEQDSILSEISSKKEKVKGLTKETNHSQTLLKKLRQQILQEAIEGKLTADWREKNPDVEPASELLARIKAEKEELIKDKEIKKQKALPSITDEEKPFDLPDGWEWCHVFDIAKIITSGSRGWAQYYANSGAMFVTMSNLSKNHYQLRMNTIRYVQPPKNSEGARTRLCEGDLLISITGDVGNLGLIPKGFGEAYVNQHTCMLRFMPECQNMFFPELMRSPLAKSQFNAPQRGMKNSFRLGDLGEMIIPLPPLAEQQAIVTKVEKLFAICDQLEAQISNNQTHAEQLMQAVLTEAFQQSSTEIISEEEAA